MALTISNFENTARLAEQQQRTGATFSLGQGGRIGLNEPLNAPGKWTNFKAFFSQIPLLKNLKGVRQARAQIDTHTQRVGTQLVANQQLMQSFMRCIQAEFGPHVSDMATRDVNIGSIPLTSRTVTTIIGKAKQEAQGMRTRNNFSMMRFLENTTMGGMRKQGEKDMIGLFLDRGIDLHGNSKWQEGLAPEQAGFIDKLFHLKCQELPEYSKGSISNTQMTEMAKDVLDTLATLQGHEDISKEQLNTILAQKTNKATSTRGLLRSIRNGLVSERTFQLMDRKNPNSLFSKAVDSLLLKMGVQEQLPDTVRKSIANDLTQEVIMSSSQSQLLGTGSKLSELLPALTKHLQHRCEQTITAHIEALDMINNLDGITPKQQESIRQLAHTQRFDTVLVAQFKKNCSLTPIISQLSDSINSGDLKKALNALRTIKETLASSLNPCQEKARSMGCYTQFDSNDSQLLINQFEKVAMADLSKPQLQELFGVMTQSGAKSLLHSMDNAPLSEAGMEFRQLSGVQRGLTEMVGKMLDIDPKTIINHLALNESPIGSILPDSLLATIGTLGDEQGVDPDSPLARQIVKTDFNIEQFRNEYKENILTHLGNDSIDKETGLSSTFHKDIHRSTFQINGKILPRENVQESLKLFSKAIQGDHEVIDKKLAKAISLCMNQNGINRMMETYSFATIGGMFVGAMGAQRTMHEAHQDDNGNWFVTSSLTYGITTVVNEQDNYLCDPNISVLLTSVTYKISSESIKQGNPTIELTDSQHYLSLSKGRD